MDVGPGPPEDCQTLDYMCSGREVVDANQETPKSTICEVDRCPEEENMEKGLNDVPICPDGTGEAKPRTLSTKVEACQPSSSKLELEDQDASPTPSAPQDGAPSQSYNTYRRNEIYHSKRGVPNQFCTLPDATIEISTNEMEKEMEKPYFCSAQCH
jgi:hypothetical protein